MLTFLSWLQHLWRNRGAPLRMGPRDSYAYRKAMQSYRDSHPDCEFCKRPGTRGSIEVHHKLPVSVAPELAADTANMVSLCKKCHLAVGHLHDFRDYNRNIVEVCEAMDSEPGRRASEAICVRGQPCDAS